MPTIRLRLSRPHPAQQQILKGATRFNVLACGRRFGKTSLTEHRLLPTLLAGRPAAYFAPTYKMLAPVWRSMRRFLAPVTIPKGASVQEKRIELFGGGELDFWSLDNYDGVRGRKYAHVVIDEAAMVADLDDAWTAAIRPTLTDLRGSADLLSTPRGRNFFWTAFCWGEDPGEPDWSAWRFPTVANPFIDPTEVEAARRLLPERTFSQEYLAEFLDESGGVFRNVLKAIDKGRKANEPPAKGIDYSFGGDLARIEDFTVLDGLSLDGRQVYFDRFNQVSWKRQIGVIRQTTGRYRAPIVLDVTGLGDPIHERLRKAGVKVRPYPMTNASKEALIDNLAMQIEQGELRLMDVPQQTNELLAYQYELSPSRKVIMNAPSGMHDDCVIALALAAWGRTRRRKLVMV